MAKKFDNRIDQFRQRLVLSDRDFGTGDIKYIGGMAAETSSFSNRNAVISLVIISCETMEVVLEETECVNLFEPLVTGHKEFRQALACVKFYEECLSSLQNRKLVPQILFIASSGILHPRKFGLACHIGLRLQIPTIGVETSLTPTPEINVEDLTQKIQDVKSGKIEIGEADASVGLALKISDEEIYYISPGDKLSVSTACTLFETYHENMPLEKARKNVSRVLSSLEDKNRLLKKLRQSPASSPQTPEFR